MRVRVGRRRRRREGKWLSRQMGRRRKDKRIVIFTIDVMLRFRHLVSLL